MKTITENLKILLYLFFLRILSGIFENIIGPLVPVISADLKVGFDYLGTVFALSAFALLFCALILGNLIELFGYKKIFFTGYLFLASGSAGLFLTKNYILFLISYFLIQLGIGTLSICSLSSIVNTFYKTRTSNIIKANIGYALGTIAAPLIAAAIIYFGFKWQNLFLILLIPVAAFFILLFFIKTPERTRENSGLRNLFNTNKEIISNPVFILIFAIVIFYAATMNTFATWFTSYFKSINIKVFTSSIFLAIYNTSLIVGLFAKNKIVKHISERKLFLAGIIFSAVMLAGALFVDSIIAKNIFIFLYGIGVTGNFSLTLSISMDLGAKYANACNAYLHAASYLGIIIFQLTSGFFLEYVSKNSVIYIDLVLLGIITILGIVLNFGKFKESGRQKLEPTDQLWQP